MPNSLSALDGLALPSSGCMRGFFPLIQGCVPLAGPS